MSGQREGAERLNPSQQDFPRRSISGVAFVDRQVQRRGGRKGKGDPSASDSSDQPDQCSANGSPFTPDSQLPMKPERGQAGMDGGQVLPMVMEFRAATRRCSRRQVRTGWNSAFGMSQCRPDYMVTGICFAATIAVSILFIGPKGHCECEDPLGTLDFESQLLLLRLIFRTSIRTDSFETIRTSRERHSLRPRGRCRGFFQPFQKFLHNRFLTRSLGIL